MTEPAFSWLTVGAARALPGCSDLSCECNAARRKKAVTPEETVTLPVEVDPTSPARPLQVAILGDLVEQFSGPVGDLGAPSYREAIRNLGAAMGEIGAAGMAVASLGIGREAAEVEQHASRLRTACPEHADAAVAEARRRAYTGLGTFERAVDSVIHDVAIGEFPADEGAEFPLVASEDPQVGFLAKWIKRLFGRDT